jgi:adenylate cyclase
MLQRFLSVFSVIVFMSVALVSVYIFLPQYHSSIDNKIKDLLFAYRGEIEQSNQVVIIDIDEKSLQHFGQWPWERDVLAELLETLSDNGAGMIGLDVMFPEADKTSPSRFANEFNISGDFENHDKIFGETVSRTPTILGYTFLFGDGEFVQREAPYIPAIFVENNLQDESNYIIEARDVVVNIPDIQDNSYSSGFFNNTPDSSGVIRSVPLISKYDGEIFPSLSLEMLRIATDTEMVQIDYEDMGVVGIGLNGIYIPTDRYGRLFVNFRGPGKSFKYISAVDIVKGEFNPEDIEGKFLLLGSSAAGLLDIRATPFDSYFPGVETHANVIDNVLAGDFISKPRWIEGADISLIVLVITVSAVLFAVASPLMFIVLFTLFGSGMMYGFYTAFFQYGIALNIFLPFLALFLMSFLLITVNFFFERKQKQLIKGKFAAKVSPAVMEDLIKSGDSSVMIGHERDITVMFSDVRNFTNISESMPDAKTLIEFLNEYMNPMTEIIIKYGGTVDKFIGDAIMAYWNAPVDVDDHSNKAVMATLEQLHTCIPLNEKIKQDPRFTATCKMAEGMGVEPIEIGIGLNSGTAVVGEMGSAGRSDYTAIGDPINLGARLESLCKYYNSLCNISNFTKERLDESKFIFRFLDLVTVKGKSEPIEIWQIHDFVDGYNGSYLFNSSKERLEEELAHYHRAIQLYKDAQFAEALLIFKDVNSWEDKSNKNVYNMYIERCEHYIQNPPEDFNGVFQHTTKG